MLILTRRVGERIVIGTDISVKVIEVRGKQARIGVDAPRGVVVHREEITEQANRKRMAPPSRR